MCRCTGEAQERRGEYVPIYCCSLPERGQAGWALGKTVAFDGQRWLLKAWNAETRMWWGERLGPVEGLAPNPSPGPTTVPSTPIRPRQSPKDGGRAPGAGSRGGGKTESAAQKGGPGQGAPSDEKGQGLGAGALALESFLMLAAMMNGDLDAFFNPDPAGGTPVGGGGIPGGEGWLDMGMAGQLLYIGATIAMIGSGQMGPKAGLKALWKGVTAFFRKLWRRLKGRLCFVAGTLVSTPNGPVPIELLSVGDRVHTVSDAPALTASSPNDAWLRAERVVHGPATSEEIRVTLLRPRAWFAAQGVTDVADTLPTGLSGLDIEGVGRVLSLTPVAAVSEGPGQRVTMTSHRLSDDVYALTFAGVDAPLRGTSEHPLYSLDRDAWVRVRDLRVGERLQTAQGAVTIAALEKVRGVHRVYNLEVEGHHEYLVGQARVRAHNKKVRPGAGKPPNRIYSARELIRRGEDPGAYHNFPEGFDKDIFSRGQRTVTKGFFKKAKPGMSNDSVMYTLPGEVNGVKGTFEIGVRPSVSGGTEVIMHRFFRKGK